MSSATGSPPPPSSGVAKYVLAAAVILGVPLAVIAYRLSSAPPPPPIVPTPPSSAAPPLARVDLEVTSTAPDAKVTLSGATHPLPWSGDISATAAEVPIIVTAPGHQGRVFHVVMDRPRRLAVTLPPGNGTADATLEELDQALNSEDDELVLGPADAGTDGGRRVAVANGLPHPKKATPTLPTGRTAEPPPAVTTAAPLPSQPTAATTPTPTQPAAPTTTTPTAAPTPTTTAEAPPVKPGTVDPKQVRATVRAHSGEVQTCYDRAHMETPDLKGRLTIDANVSATGQVQSAQASSSDIRSPRLENCILGAFRTWTFPPPAGGVPGTVTYSFVFKE